MNEKALAPNAVTIDVEQIKEMIPHRPPFLLVDRVTDLVAGERAVGIKDVRADEYYFEGHFPGHPIMPGVLIVEAMAQTSAVLVIHSLGKQDDNLVYLMSVDQARFRKPVYPGDRLHFHVERIQNRGRVWKFKGEARVEGELRAEATYSAIIVENK